MPYNKKAWVGYTIQRYCHTHATYKHDPHYSVGVFSAYCSRCVENWQFSESNEQ